MSYFNGGDAVHYFDRGSLRLAAVPRAAWSCRTYAAKQAYPYLLPYGTLVTVTEG